MNDYTVQIISRPLHHDIIFTHVSTSQPVLQFTIANVDRVEYSDDAGLNNAQNGTLPKDATALRSESLHEQGFKAREWTVVVEKDVGACVVIAKKMRGGAHVLDVSTEMFGVPVTTHTFVYNKNRLREFVEFVKKIIG